MKIWFPAAPGETGREEGTLGGAEGPGLRPSPAPRPPPPGPSRPVPGAHGPPRPLCTASPRLQWAQSRLLACSQPLPPSGDFTRTGPSWQPGHRVGYSAQHVGTRDAPLTAPKWCFPAATGCEGPQDAVLGSLGRSPAASERLLGVMIREQPSAVPSRNISNLSREQRPDARCSRPPAPASRPGIWCMAPAALLPPSCWPRPSLREFYSSIVSN